MVKFPKMSMIHKLDLFDKLVEPVLNYRCEVWTMGKAANLGNIHMQFCKHLL